MMTLHTYKCLVLLLLALPGYAAAQACEIPDHLRALTPVESPPRGTYEPLSVGPAERIPLGIGHLHYSVNNPVVDLPPGEDNWLQRVALPLSRTPGAEPSTAILRGWVVTTGRPPEALTTRAFVETGYEEISFIVLEGPSDGWLRIRYGAEEGDGGVAWTPSCALVESPARLDFTPWREWFMSERVSPLFARFGGQVELRTEASPGSTLITSASGDYSLEPVEVRADWMRVILKQPSDYCRPEAGSRSEEGWIQWSTEEAGPIVWYFTRGC